MTESGRTARRRRWVLPAVVTAWALVLGGLAYHSYRNDPATVRDQRTLAQAAPVAEAAFGAVLARAAAGAGNGTPVPIVAVGAARVTEGCRVTTARTGAELTRSATVYLAPEDGPALLRVLAAEGALPAGYRIWLGLADDGAPKSFRVDAGEFVGMRGEFAEPGVLRVSLNTGCRPVDGGLPTEPGAVPDAMTAGRAEGALAALGATASRTAESAVACPGGRGSLATVVAAGIPAAAPVLAEVLAPLAEGGRVLVSGERRYAYSTDPEGREGIAVEVADGEIEVSATTSCR